MSSQEPIVIITSCDFAYRPSEPVLEDVNLTIVAGEFASIIGPNGGGKTTLVRLMLGLLTPQRGSVTLFGGNPAETRLRVGYVPQQVHSDRLFPISVLDVVLTGRIGAATEEKASVADRLGRAFFRYTRADTTVRVRHSSRWIGRPGKERSATSGNSAGADRRAIAARQGFSSSTSRQTTWTAEATSSTSFLKSRTVGRRF